MDDVDDNDNSFRGRSKKETLAIPEAVRAAVDARDMYHCRVCGRYMGQERALHHIKFGGDERGMGGRRVHEVDEIVTVCWMWGANCHDRVHRDKKKWAPLLLEVVHKPGATAMQLLRWAEQAARRKQ